MGSSRSIPVGFDGVPDNVNYGESGDFHPNPFPDDEIRHTVTADNMEQYAEYLTEGTRALLETYPDTYEIQVYPSRRTMAWPEWVLENIEDNATDAELVAGGDGIDGAYGGIPFPILHGSNEDQASRQSGTTRPAGAASSSSSIPGKWLLKRTATTA